MEYVYLGAIIGLCLFNFWSYRRGLKDGLALNQGKPIEPIKSPLQAVTEHREKVAEKKEAKVADDLLTTGIANILAYNGDKQPDPRKEGGK